MSWLSDLFTRLGWSTDTGYIPARGTFAKAEGETFPVAIANQILGGAHGYPSIGDLKKISLDQLDVPMQALVVDGDNIKRFILSRLPEASDFTNGVLENFESFWFLESVLKEFGGEAILTEYADDYASSSDQRPPYPSDPTDPDYATKIQAYHDALAPYDQWYSTIKVTSNWIRESIDGGLTWGPPISMGGVPIPGDFVDVIFKYFPNDGTNVPAPEFYKSDGTLNNDPSGWGNTIADITKTNVDDRLFMTFTLKNIKGQIQSRWVTPIYISDDDTLTQFGQHRDTPDAEWVGVSGFVRGVHRWMRRRINISSPWIYTIIDNEAGIIEKIVYKAYLLSLLDSIRDNPDNYRPQGTLAENNALDTNTDAWQITQPTEATDKVVIGSKGLFRTNGQLIGEWGDPFAFSGKDTVVDSIITPDGLTFKTKLGATNPSSITLRPHLTRGNTVISSGVTYTWKRIRNNSTSLNETITSIVTTDALYLSGNDLIVKPDGVDGSATFQLTQSFAGLTFTETVTVADVTDGIGVVTDISSSSKGFVFAIDDSVSKVISFSVHDNGTPVAFASLTGVSFKLDGTTVTNGATYNGEVVTISGSQITITAAMVTNKLTIEYGYTYVGSARTATIDIVKQQAGIGLDILFHDEYVDASGTNVAPPITSPGTVADNISPNGTWYEVHKESTKWVVSKPQTTTTWGTPSRIGGTKGNPGQGGYRALIYTRAATKPPKPTGMRKPGGFSPQLGDKTLPLEDNWVSERIEGDGNLYVSEGFFIDPTGGGTYYLVGEWSDPVKTELPTPEDALNPYIMLYLYENYS